MRKVVLIPTYWSRERAEGWQEGDAVYDHPTPLDEEGTLQRTLESMKLLTYKDFKLVLLICPTTPDISDKAMSVVKKIVKKAGLKAETYLFTVNNLERIADIVYKHDVDRKTAPLLTMMGYAHVRNMCLLCADILAADAAILIDDDEVFEIPEWIERSVEFLGKRVYGEVVYGMAGYYINKHDQYYDDVVPEAWMSYWDRFGAKSRAFDEIIGGQPRIKRTPFAFGGAMIMHRDLFRCVPFDPHITRGEDIDYLINSRMYGFNFFLDNTLPIKHLPVPKKHPQWKRIREDIYRFVYQKAKINSQVKIGSMVMVTPEDFDPYPGEFLREDLEEKIFRSNMMIAADYMMKGDAEGCAESLNNIAIGKKEAKPDFDAFSRYRQHQKLWEQITTIVAKERYLLRKIMEENNLSAKPLVRDSKHEREMDDAEIAAVLRKTFEVKSGEPGWQKLRDIVFVSTYYEDEVVFLEGDFNNAIYILLKGELVLFSGTHETGGEVEIARLKRGDILGETSMSNSYFTLNCRAVQFTELIGMDRAGILRLAETSPEIGMKIFRVILSKAVEKLRVVNRQNISMAGGAVEGAYIDTIYTNANDSTAE